MTDTQTYKNKRGPETLSGFRSSLLFYLSLKDFPYKIIFIGKTEDYSSSSRLSTYSSSPSTTK